MDRRDGLRAAESRRSVRAQPNALAFDGPARHYSFAMARKTPSPFPVPARPTNGSASSRSAGFPPPSSTTPGARRSMWPASRSSAPARAARTEIGIPYHPILRLRSHLAPVPRPKPRNIHPHGAGESALSAAGAGDAAAPTCPRGRCPSAVASPACSGTSFISSRENCAYDQILGDVAAGNGARDCAYLVSGSRRTSTNWFASSPCWITPIAVAS